MKNIALIFILFIIPIIGITQTKTNESKFIEVIGSAEKLIIADQFEVSVSIKEYYIDDKLKEKKPISEIEEEFLMLLKKLNLQDDDVSISNIGSLRGAENNKSEILISKTYILKLFKVDLLNELLSTVDTKYIANMYILNMTNNKILQYRKDLRIEALRQAAEKATYLLESVGEELGELISISELDSPTYGRYGSQSMSNMISDLSNIDNTQIGNLQKIKLTYSIKVKYAIK